MNLRTPIKEMGGIYKRYQNQLEKLGINVFEDFLYHVPFRYENYSIISDIAQLQPGEKITIQGRVVEIKNEFTKKWKKLQKAKVRDETGEIEIIWFNQPYLVNVIKKNDLVSLSGKIDFYIHGLVMQSPDYEIINGQSTIHTGRLVPIYPETRGISSKWIRRQTYKLITDNHIQEYLPDSILSKNKFMSLNDSIKQIHFPYSIESSEKARERLSFDELFLLKLKSMERRYLWEKNLHGNPFSISEYKSNIEKFWSSLPFVLTNAQQKAVKDIFGDLAKKKPMNRLLEGDVGSGKTVVAAIGMYLAYLNGYQSVLMAPTEILANQHFTTISNLLSPFSIKIELLTGNSKIKKLNTKNSKSQNSESDIIVGTHAVLSKNIEFNKLGFVVIDEQQRFGVEQRAVIKQKGKNPHLLTMTATPIPRTVALTMYGDLDLSYLDEMPKGRKQIKTWLVPQEKRESAYRWINEQIKKTKSQVFIICPFIEQSESMQTVKAATKEFESLKKKFKSLTLGLLHGKLKGKEKNNVLSSFKEGKIDILVATPVVEVGIDIPNATIIVIEAADRFGLSQLHQLRGRVGRGDKQSYCLLFTDLKGEYTRKRLKAMETINVGSELAELDLKLRGAGELYGTMQHGIGHLKIASFSDFTMIEKSKKEAKDIFPKLSKYPKLLEKLNSISGTKVYPD